MGIFSKLSRKNVDDTGPVPVVGEGSPLQMFQFPSEGAKMEDYIAIHKNKPSLFEYVTISSRARQTKGQLREGLIAGRKVSISHEDELSNIPSIKCVDKTISLALLDYLPKNHFRKGMEWFQIKAVFVYFAPAQSGSSPYSKVRVSLIDRRLCDNTITRSVTSPSCFGFDARMSLDHSVAIDDAHCLSLQFECTNNALREGIAWGSLRIAIKIGQSVDSLPQSSEDTVAVLRMPDSSLVRRTVNPNHVNLDLDQEDMNALIDMYNQGRIIDPLQPVNRQQRIAHVASVYVPSDDGQSDAGECRFENATTRLSPEPRRREYPTRSAMKISVNPSPPGSDRSHRVQDDDESVRSEPITQAVLNDRAAAILADQNPNPHLAALARYRKTVRIASDES